MQIAPLNLAASWDNVGLLIGDPRTECDSVLLTIDLTDEVLQEAKRLGCRMVISYHPPIFRPLSRIGPGDLAYGPLRYGICVYSVHTALDAASAGTNEVLCDTLGIEDYVPLEPRKDNPELGMGRIGHWQPSLTRADAIVLVKNKLGLAHLMVAGPRDGNASCVAVCAGSGGSLLGAAIEQGADVMVVGELGHHEALRAARAGITVLATLHSHTERLALPKLRAMLNSYLPTLSVHLSAVDVDPFVIV
jgi:dinuclear metal center YbgI/SA1388 family protein